MLFLLSLLFGIYIYSKLNNDSIVYLKNNINNFRFMSIKNIFIHFIIINLSFALSFCGIGFLIILFYLLFESMVMGFMTAYFFSLYKLSGIFYSIVYIFIYKLLLLFLLIVLAMKFYKIFKTTIEYVKHNKINITKTIINSFIIMFFLYLFDFFVLFTGKYLLNLFSFLIK